MRVKVINKSDRPDEILIPLAEYAAAFFPHRTGTVEVVFKTARSGYPRGRCYGRRTCYIWIERLGATQMKYPATFDQMHYFRHANHEAVKPLTAAGWKEYCLNVIAHEMEHTTKGNRLMRRSRQEIHAWNRGVQVVEASRTLEAQSVLRKRGEEIVAAGLAKIEKREAKKTPESKRAHLEGLMMKWFKKAKLAQTKIRKLKTRIRYYEKKESLAASGRIMPCQE